MAPPEYIEADSETEAGKELCSPVEVQGDELKHGRANVSAGVTARGLMVNCQFWRVCAPVLAGLSRS